MNARHARTVQTAAVTYDQAEHLWSLCDIPAGPLSGPDHQARVDALCDALDEWAAVSRCHGRHTVQMKRTPLDAEGRALVREAAAAVIALTGWLVRLEDGRVVRVPWNTPGRRRVDR